MSTAYLAPATAGGGAYFAPSDAPTNAGGLISGASAGTSTAVATLLTGVVIQGTANGVSQASATLTFTLYLSGGSKGTATCYASLTTPGQSITANTKLVVSLLDAPYAMQFVQTEPKYEIQII